MSKVVSLIPDVHQIVSGDLAIVNDGEYDVLYSGRNKYETRVLGAILKEDEEKGCMTYVHVLLKSGDYSSFLRGAVTLKSLYQNSQALFFVDKTYGGRFLGASIATWEDIPEDHRPLDNSFCPAFSYEPSFEFDVSMKDGRSEEHLVLPHETNEVNESFTRFIDASLSWTKRIGIKAIAYNEGLMAASFKIRFRVELPEMDQTSIAAVDITKVRNLLPSILKLAVSKGIRAEVMTKETIEHSSPEFQTIMSGVNEIFDEVHAMRPTVDEMRKVLAQAVQPMQGLQFSDSFKRIEIDNLDTRGAAIPIGVVDEQYVAEANEVPADPLKVDITVKDETPRSYAIQVTNFNIENGNGKAYVGNDKKTLGKVSIYVRGRKSYDGTHFTQSMHEKDPFDIKGKAVRVNGRIKSISIELPPQKGDQ
ncbi:MAG: hypothetical protein IPP26_01580 [Flavobacteriales bacterium]|nr:hypothetical protein [Flavobacteriales bacterium]